VPIDFVAIAARFDGPLRAQTDRMPLVFARLARTAARLRREVDRADRATRALPLVRFRDGALAVRVLRAVAPVPVAVGADLGGGVRAFGAGIAWVGTAVRQELLVPRLGQMVVEALDRVEGATDRVLRLDPSLFATGRQAGRAFELPALGALGLGMAAEAGLLRPKPAMIAPPSPGGPPGAAAAAVASLDPAVLPELLTEVSAALVLALPAAAVVLVGEVRILGLEAKLRLVDELTKAEASLLGVHTTVVEVLVGAGGPIHIVADWFPIIQAMVEGDLELVERWLPRVAGDLMEGIDRFVDAVNGTSRIVVIIVQVTIDLVEALASFPLVPALGLTIGDLMNAATDAAALAAVATAAVALEELGDAVAPMSPRDGLLYRGFGRMLRALARQPMPRITPAPLPTSVTPLPDLVGRLFPQAIDTVLADYARGAVDDVRGAIVGSLDASAGVATQLGRTATAISARAQQGLGGLQLDEVAGVADAFAEDVIGDERRRALGPGPGRGAGRQDALLALFAGIGFQIVGRLLPLYLAGVARTVRERPTSPHILARRGRLVGVRSPAVRVRAEGLTTDAASAEQVADQLRAAFGRLYVEAVATRG
jgi:hypothetical protein